MALHLPLQALRRAVVLLRERLPDQGNRLRRVRTSTVQQVRMLRAAVRLARPQGNVIQ